MRFALFCDGAYSMTVAAIEAAVHELAIAEAEAVRAAAVARSRTPKGAIVTSTVERRPVTATRSRKENTAAVRSYNL